jgi:hypothetical protein
MFNGAANSGNRATGSGMGASSG